jgi:integral membrane protein
LRPEEKEATETLFIMWKTPIGRLRAVGLLEGTSFLVLLFIAMPLKYFAGMPLAVKLVGWAHGLLFMLYLLTLGHTASSRRWPLLRVGAGFLASVVPFGPFVFDVWLRREELLPAEERQ